MVTVISTDPQAPEVAGLLQQLDGYQSSLYPAASNHLDSVELLASTHAYFVAAYAGSDVLGCGAIKYMRDDCLYGEIKRLFVKPKARGKGVAKKIMANLEQHAQHQKARALRLETGIYQTAALHLYARLGFCRSSAFGDYLADPLSVFMEKRL